YQPHAVALCVPGESHSIITYEQLARLIRNVARNADAAGLNPADVVVTFVEDGVMHALLLLGLTYAGMVPLSGRNANLPLEIQIDAILCDGPRTFAGGRRVIQIDRSWLEGGGAFRHVRSPWTIDDTCRIIFASGTTGDAKGVAYSHRMVIERT